MNNLRKLKCKANTQLLTLQIHVSHKLDDHVFVYSELIYIYFHEGCNVILFYSVLNISFKIISRKPRYLHLLCLTMFTYLLSDTYSTNSMRMYLKRHYLPLYKHTGICKWRLLNEEWMGGEEIMSANEEKNIDFIRK